MRDGVHRSSPGLGPCMNARRWLLVGLSPLSRIALCSVARTVCVSLLSILPNLEHVVFSEINFLMGGNYQGEKRIARTCGEEQPPVCDTGGVILVRAALKRESTEISVYARLHQKSRPWKWEWQSCARQTVRRIRARTEEE